MARLKTALTPAIAPVTTQTTTTSVRMIVSAKIDALMEEHVTISAKLAQLEARKEQIKKEEIALHAKHGVRFDTVDWEVKQVAGTHTGVSRAKLVQLGVKASVIDAATERTPYVYTMPKRKAKGGE